MNYNQKRHIELLKRSQYFKSQKKSFFKENPKEDLEFCRYDGAIAEHIYQKNRHEFALLMGNFINGRINGEDFSEDFSFLSQQLKNTRSEFISELVSEKLKDFQPDVRSARFGSLISFLRAECDNFSEDYDNKEFYDSIKDCFLKLQKALDEELNNLE